MRTPSQGGEEESALYFSSPPRNGVRIIFLDILPMLMEGGLRTRRSRLPSPSRGGEEEYSSSPPHNGVDQIFHHKDEEHDAYSIAGRRGGGEEHATHFSSPIHD